MSEFRARVHKILKVSNKNRILLSKNLDTMGKRSPKIQRIAEDFSKDPSNLSYARNLLTQIVADINIQRKQMVRNAIHSQFIVSDF